MIGPIESAPAAPQTHNSPAHPQALQAQGLHLSNRAPWQASDTRVKHSVAIASMIAMWLLYFIVTTGLSVLLGAEDLTDYIAPRFMVVMAGIACTFLLYAFLQRFQPQSFRARLALALGMAVPLVVTYAVINMMFFYYWFPSADTAEVIQKLQERFFLAWQAVVIIDSSVRWYFFFAVWATLYVAFGYANEMRAVERRANAYRLEAKNAQLRALHYQIKPHFLFNTLNSLSTLVLRGAKEDAETMIMNLSAFLRRCLEVEPDKLVSLADEISLQKLYLDIELTRFPKRLHINFDIPHETENIAVPALILQPLIENAIKYGVGATHREIGIHIRASIDATHLYLRVENQVDHSAVPPSSGTGLGLRNVRERLATCFGPHADCEWGQMGEDGFFVFMRIPIAQGD